eukprot:TRINITY_DN15379_c0_g1_i1.p1 TRINITY_DN15379_c0_g1~~TRINITY_DN15379_c0_g1_i1.p1  ORF type:complete len:332 (+),score=55.38 TRINITY_DN15379_c0_g1_i1:94-996(+)
MVQFEPDEVGYWVIDLKLIADVCGTIFTRWNLNVDCSTPPLSLSLPVSEPEDFIDWRDNKFDKVELSASHMPPAYELDIINDVEYWWVVTSAPADSTYVPQCYDTVGQKGDPASGNCYNYYESTTLTPDRVNHDNDTYTLYSYLTETTTTEEYFSFVKLAPIQPVARVEEYDRFLACFFADVPGVYTFELNVAIQCGLSPPLTLSISARCNGEPDVVAICESCDVNNGANTISLTGSKYGRVLLDGSGSTDGDEQSAPGESGDRVTYWWTGPRRLREEYEKYDGYTNNVSLFRTGIQRTN